MPTAPTAPRKRAITKVNTKYETDLRTLLKGRRTDTYIRFHHIYIYALAGMGSLPILGPKLNFGVFYGT